ncbi:MAG: family 20 glycosylhydrolase [Treponemataceae bacterium]|nr:family 20 glycosylhydrolase [Treponemataceae bacterium]
MSSVVLEINEDRRQTWEGYRIKITPEKIEITVAAPVIQTKPPTALLIEYAAAACATVMQLLHFGWDGWHFAIPEGTIEDRPSMEWRGLMIDCARHFVPISELKKILSLAWLYKINRFHWHLTDDQGWRIEVLQFPELTEIGSQRSGADPFRNGFYTQRDIQDLISYAADRGITVVPEIDLPGHAQALLASHPEFSCTGGPFAVRTEWGIAQDVLCMGNAKVVPFVKQIWDEVCELFPGPYVHIGGDECPTERWEQCPHCGEQKKVLGLKQWIDLHGYFIREITDYLTFKGKVVFGWDEVLDSALPNRCNVVHWRAWLDGQSMRALEQGRDVVISPSFPYYFDFVQTQDRKLSPGIGYRAPAAASLKMVYEFDPLNLLQEKATGLSAEAKTGIALGDWGTVKDQKEGSQGIFRGIQANVWTEFIRDPRRLEYMVFPRLLAVAETGWNGAGKSRYGDFVDRLEQGHTKSARGIFIQRGINFCPLYESM